MAVPQTRERREIIAMKQNPNRLLERLGIRQDDKNEEGAGKRTAIVTRIEDAGRGLKNVVPVVSLEFARQKPCVETACD